MKRVADIINNINVTTNEGKLANTIKNEFGSDLIKVKSSTYSDTLQVFLTKAKFNREDFTVFTRDIWELGYVMDGVNISMGCIWIVKKEDMERK